MDSTSARPAFARLTDGMSRTDAVAESVDLGPRMKRLGYFVSVRRWGTGWAVYAVPAPDDSETPTSAGQLV
ncbi:hypothetical protein [Streptacidiphilus sp. PAMC 29251]